MIPIQDDGKTVTAGAALTLAQQEALRANSVQFDDNFFNNLSTVNEEIEDTNKAIQEAKVTRKSMTTTPQARPAPSRRVEPRTTPKAVPVSAPAPSLADDLDNLSSQAKEEVPAAPAQDMRSQILALFNNVKDPPTDADIRKWKAEHGEVYALGLGKGDIYVFTHLTRMMWKKVQEVLADIQKRGGVEGAALEDQLKEKVVTHCVLWPRPLTPSFFYNSKAGVVPALYDAVMMNSYFLTPQQTAMLTVTL